MFIPQGYFCSFSAIWCSKAFTEIKEKQVYFLQSWVAKCCQLQKSDYICGSQFAGYTLWRPQPPRAASKAY